MKKTNKILTRALVILLALVLITSSVVSSTFAKYVVRKQAAVTVGLEAFGLTVSLTGIDALGEETQTDKKGDSVSISYTGVKLKPGDERFINAVTASVTGEPNVPADVKIDVSVVYGGEQFKVTNDDFEGKAGTYVPIVFYVGGKSVTTAYDDLTTDEAVTNIKGGLPSGFSNGVYKITKDAQGNFTLPDPVTFGFEWPLNAGNGDNVLLFDQIGTWLARDNNDNASTVTITYTISVEQDTTASN